MQGRRILLFIAILLLATGAVSALVAPPTEREPEADEPAYEHVPPPPAFRGDGDDTERIAFDARDGRRTERVEAGRHVIVTVRAQKPGQVEIDKLGLIQSIGPGAPAVFDLFTDRPGRFEIAYEPIDGSPRRVGELEVEREASSASGNATRTQS